MPRVTRKSDHYGLPPRSNALYSQQKSQRSAPSVDSREPRSSITGRGGFEMMDVTVSVLGLQGILVDSKMSKEKNKEGLHKQVPSSGSTVTSESNCTYDSDELSLGASPVTAVVSFSKNVSSSQTTIATHLPSLPLKFPSSSFFNKHRYNATWPTDFDPMGNELSTFKCCRLMKKEFIGSDQVPGQDANDFVSVFVPEKINVKVSLMQGSDMIALGATTIVITGEEEEELQLNLPIKTTKGALKDKVDDQKQRKSGKLFGKSPNKKNSKSLKPLSFPKCPSHKYSLDENSCLRVLIKSSPSTSDYLQVSIRDTNSLHDHSSDYPSSTFDHGISHVNSIHHGDSETSIFDFNTSAPSSGPPLPLQIRTQTSTVSARKDYSNAENEENRSETDFNGEIQDDHYRIPHNLQISNEDEEYYVYDENIPAHANLTPTTLQALEKLKIKQEESRASTPANFFSCGGMCSVNDNDHFEDTAHKKKKSNLYTTRQNNAHDLGATNSNFLPPSKVYTKTSSSREDSLADDLESLESNDDYMAEFKHPYTNRSGLTSFSASDEDSYTEADTYYTRDGETAYYNEEIMNVDNFVGSQRNAQHQKGANNENIKMAREMIHKYANRMGVNPEELI